MAGSTFPTAVGEDNRSGVFRFDLKTGEGGLWCRDAMSFANGMAMAPDGNGLYVVESDAPCVSYVPIEADGSAGPKRVVVEDVRNVPDGARLRPGRLAVHLLLRAEPHLSLARRIAGWNC